MSTYRELRGLKVKYLAADPDPGTAGDVWYDSATYQLKGFVGRAAWSAGANLVTGRRFLGGTGTQTSALAFAGYGTALSAATEEYNGTGWAAGGDLNDAKEGVGGFGTQTASVSIGGKIPGVTAQVEEYNGSTWAEVTNVPAVIAGGAGAGTLTAGLFFGGSVPGKSDVTLEYDGTNWTTGGALNTARGYLGGLGTQTAASAIAGLGPAPGNVTIQEQYDGSSWTEVGAMNTARRSLGASGSTTAALGFAGYTSTAVANTEIWDGTTWTETADIGTARYRVAAGTSSPALTSIVFGGGPGAKTITEEWNNSFEVVTAGAWASMTNFPDTRAYAAASGGTPSSSLVFGGYDGAGLGGFVSSGAEWDGSSWTGTGDYPIDVAGVAGLGPVTAGLGCGGYKDNATNVATTAEYDGSSWTAGNNANAVGQGAKMAGTQTAGSMGNRSGDENGHEQYNGSTWTAATDTPVAASAGAMMAGTQSALLMYGGEASNKKRTESWDGSSWTSLTDMAFDRRQGAHGGTQTIAIAGGGDSNPGVIANTELWDGTSWVSGPNMATARFYQVGGTSTGTGVTGCIAATGRPASATLSNTCEEFTGETTATTASTIDFD